MVHCVAPGCSNDNCNESGRQLTFFSFPKDAKQRREWVVKMGRAPRGKTAYFEPLKNDRLCSAHFENSCFQRDLRAEFAADGLLEAGSVRAPKRLKAGAIPTMILASCQSFVTQAAWKYITRHNYGGFPSVSAFIFGNEGQNTSGSSPP